MYLLIKSLLTKNKLHKTVQKHQEKHLKFEHDPFFYTSKNNTWKLLKEQYIVKL